MSRFNFGRTSNTPPVVKNLIIINVVMVVALMLSGQALGINLNQVLGLHYIESPMFRPWQIVTYMFMHANPLGRGGLWHIVFNMYALWIFGQTLERVWGGKRFFIFYMVTGLGAAFINELVQFIELAPKIAEFKAFYNVDSLTMERLTQSFESTGQYRGMIQNLLTPTVGASGAVFGILLAFGMLFPNTPLYFFFVPIPIKAKYMVIGYGLLELYLGVTQPGSNIAHFAHLGGMIFGFILIKYWNKRGSSFY